MIPGLHTKEYLERILSFKVKRCVSIPGDKKLSKTKYGYLA